MKKLKLLLVSILAVATLAGCANTPPLEQKVTINAEPEQIAEKTDKAQVSAEEAKEEASGNEIVSENAASENNAVQPVDISFSDENMGSTTAPAWTNVDEEKKKEPLKDEDYAHRLNIYCLDADKADAFILYSGNRNAVVIDCGKKKDGEDITEYLKEKGLDHVSALIITHFDKDHVGGAYEVIMNNDVENVYTTYMSKSSKRIDDYNDAMELRNKEEIVVRKEITFEVDGTTYQIIPAGKPDYAKDDSNNSSLVIKVTNGEHSMLFTGDAQEERISELVNRTDLKSEIIKMPHHGKYEANLDFLLNAVRPKYAVITSSEKEPADPVTLKLLEQHNIKTYNTVDGDIEIEFIGDRTNITVDD
ncbi:MAG: MBL fold metallo-hydrolase [Lachnospiraceae bacterium]|nr:MBL fold metallo-hydrolase [Lachnospiraceae bacterium]